MRISRNSIIMILIILICIGGIGYVHVRVMAIRGEMALRQQQIDAAPMQQIETEKMRKELEKAQNSMSGIQRMVVKKDKLPEVVQAIASVASASGVSAQVPQVTQSTSKGTPENDPLDDVRMHISASGTSASLMAFLYRVEQLPYLLYVASWNIDTSHQVAMNFFSVAPADDSANTAPQGSSLEFDIIISILK